MRIAVELEGCGRAVEGGRHKGHGGRPVLRAEVLLPAEEGALMAATVCVRRQRGDRPFAVLTVPPCVMNGPIVSEPSSQPPPVSPGSSPLTPLVTSAAWQVGASCCESFMLKSSADPESQFGSPVRSNVRVGNSHSPSRPLLHSQAFQRSWMLRVPDGTT